MKNIVKIIKYIGIFAIMLCLCMSLLYVSCLIPSSNLKENIEESIEVINRNGSKKFIKVFNKEIMFDTYADAMMINTAYSIDSKHPFYSMLFARSNYVDGVTDETYEDTAYKKNKISKFPYVQELEMTLRGAKLVAIEYARYWHGYLIFLRPLLTIFNYTEIKILSYIFHFILFLLLLYNVKKKIGGKYIIAIIFSFIVTEGYLVYSCLEETIGYTLILVASNVFFCIKDRHYGKFFFYLGIFTAFFDLLTIPVAIFIFPLLLYILLNNEKSLKEIIIQSVKYVFLVVVGYAAMWLSKWVIVDFIYNRNLIQNALLQALYRSSTEGIKLFAASRFNLLYLGKPVAIYTGIIYCINIVVVIVEKIKLKKVSDILKKNLVISLVGLSPFVWYTLVREHSLSHAYFTHRSLIVTCVLAQVMMINILDKYFKNSKKEIFTIFALVDVIVIILNYIV